MLARFFNSELDVGCFPIRVFPYGINVPRRTGILHARRILTEMVINYNTQRADMRRFCECIVDRKHWMEAISSSLIFGRHRAKKV